MIGYYVALYAATGLLMPYLPVYFLSLGFSGAQVATISSVSAAATVVVPPVWGYLADRTGRAATLLTVATAGWAAALALQLGARGFGAVLGAAAIQSLFGPSLSALADALTVAAARQAGVEYARVRLWGSVGFIATSLAFGQALAAGVRPAAVIPLGLAAATVAIGFAWAAPRGLSPLGKPPSLGAVGGLLRERALLVFLGAAGLHWASFSPFTLFLEPHLAQATGSRGYVGPCLAVAVGAEVVGMRYFEKIRKRVPLLGLLGLSFALNAVRWWVLSAVSSGAVALLVQVIHGLAFGVFFVGSIAFLEKVVPAELRSTGRALYGAVAFGLGGVGGHQLAGHIYDAHGTRGAFRASVGLELGALALLGVVAAVTPRRAAEG